MARLAAALLIALVAPGAFSADPGGRPLSRDEVARGQAAIERIDGRRRLDAAQVAVVEGRFQLAPTEEVLEGELARLSGAIATGRLGEIYAALNRDPLLIRECLARPAWVERVGRELFTFDPALHADSRTEAVELRRRLVSGELSPWLDHPGRSVLELTRRSAATVGQVSSVAEERDGFVLSVVLSETASRVRVAKYVVPKLTFEAWLGADLGVLPPGPDQFNFCATAGAGIVLAIDGEPSPVSVLDAARRPLPGEGHAWKAPDSGVYIAQVDRDPGAARDDYLLSVRLSSRTGVIETADLWVASYASPIPAVSGSLLTYTVVIHNDGPDAALDVEMRHFLPEDATFESLTVPVSGDGPWDCTSPVVGGKGKVSCTKKCFAPGGAATFMVTVRVAACLGDTPLSSTTTASALTLDPIPENNAADRVIPITDDGTCDDGAFCTSGDRCAPGPDVIFQEDFDGVVLPNVPPGWSAVLVVGPDGGRAWRSVDLNFDTEPNSVFGLDAPDIRDSILDSPPIPITSPASKLRFRNRYDLEKDNDGGVLEIKIGDGVFDDILAHGGSFVEGGYTGVISLNFASPIAGRQAWTGQTAGFVQTTVNLPAAAVGQTIVLRWRLATDRSLARVGQWVDSISITDHDVCATGPLFTCDDHDACTIDSCDPVLGCGSVWVSCDDGTVCTDDVCDPVLQCLHSNNVAPCDDHDACTIADACAAGVCVGGAPVVCDDFETCTADACDPILQCLSSNVNFDASGFSAARVDGRDLAVFAAAWNACPTDPPPSRYNPAADLDHRATCINLDDFHLFMSSFGRDCSP